MSDSPAAFAVSPSALFVRSRWLEPVALLAMLLLLIAWDFSGWDLLISQSFAGPGGFPMQHSWLTHAVLHTGGKLFYGCCVLVLIANYRKPIFAQFDVDRASQRWWIVTMVLTIGAISLLKYLSKSSCPWDLQSFGGIAAQLSHWDFVTPDGGPGRCFPSGHLSGAFSLLAVHYALRPISMEWASRALGSSDNWRAQGIRSNGTFQNHAEARFPGGSVKVGRCLRDGSSVHWLPRTTLTPLSLRCRSCSDPLSLRFPLPFCRLRETPRPTI